MNNNQLLALDCCAVRTLISIGLLIDHDTTKTSSADQGVCWPGGKTSASRAAVLGSIPAFPVHLSPGESPCIFSR